MHISLATKTHRKQSWICSKLTPGIPKESAFTPEKTFSTKNKKKFHFCLD